MGALGDKDTKKLYVYFEIPKTIEEFIDRYFSKNIEDRENIWVSGDATYHDKECLELHCKLGKLRSFDDLLILVKTYYPCTKKKLLKCLFKREYNKKTIYVNYCGSINKPTIWFYTNHSPSLSYTYLPLQWKNLLKLINIDSHQDFINIKKKKWQK